MFSVGGGSAKSRRGLASRSERPSEMSATRWDDYGSVPPPTPLFRDDETRRRRRDWDDWDDDDGDEEPVVASSAGLSALVDAVRAELGAEASAPRLSFF